MLLILKGRNKMYAAKYSVKTKTLLTAITVMLAVVLPQILHLAGGNSLGEIWLPMHLPVILAGFIAGPAVGAISGVMAPAVSFLISGMPSAVILPFIAIELCCYGLFSGLLANVKMPSVLKVLSVQVGGRAVRAIAIIIAAALGSAINPEIIITSVVTGVCGIVLQLLVIPPVLSKLNEK